MPPVSDADNARIADALTGIAAILKPPVSTTPATGTTTTPGTQYGGGGTVVTPNFPGRMTPDPALWNPAFAFEENFPVLAKEGGEFLSKYTKWGAYPDEYLTTSRKGYYEPNNISVVDTDSGLRVLQNRLVPGSKTGDSKGRPSGCAATPNWGPNRDGRSKGEFVQARIRVAKPAAGWHAAFLGWPLKDSDWPRLGEPDWWEGDLTKDAKVGGWLHVQNGGSNGERQVQLVSDVPVTDWFVVGFERIAGKVFNWYVNGKKLKSVTTDVPNDFFRKVLQLEDNGTPTEEAIVQVDWYCESTPK